MSDRDSIRNSCDVYTLCLNFPCNLSIKFQLQLPTNANLWSHYSNCAICHIWCMVKTPTPSPPAPSPCTLPPSLSVSHFPYYPHNCPLAPLHIWPLTQPQPCLKHNGIVSKMKKCKCCFKSWTSWILWRGCQKMANSKKDYKYLHGSKFGQAMSGA